MSIQILWDDDDKTIMRQVFCGRWTVEEYRHIIEKTEKLLKGLPHTVHIIMDLRQSENTPSNILSTIRFAASKITDNLGTVVFVGANEFDHTWISMAARIAPRLLNRHHHAPSLGDAHAYIARSRGKISPTIVPAL